MRYAVSVEKTSVSMTNKSKGQSLKFCGLNLEVACTQVGRSIYLLLQDIKELAGKIRPIKQIMMDEMKSMKQGMVFIIVNQEEFQAELKNEIKVMKEEEIHLNEVKLDLKCLWKTLRECEES